jgi:hypothetical protein
MAGDYHDFYRDCNDIPGNCPAAGFYTPRHNFLILFSPLKAPIVNLSALLSEFRREG